jgi:hypothetical protein
MLRWAEIKKLRNTFKYLAAWFLLSDGPLFRSIPQSLFTHVSHPRLCHYNLNRSSLR